MTRYIDADEMSRRFAHYGESHMYDAFDLDDMLAEMQTIDAVEVVRCEGCRFWRNEHLCLVMSRYGSIDTKAEHYCSWGERKQP